MPSRGSTLSRRISVHWVWLALFCLAFAPTAAWLWHRWTLSIWYNGHGMFVPLIVAYLVRENLKRDPIVEPASSAWGFLFLVPGLAMLALDTAIRTQLLAAVGLVLCLPGLSLLLFGVGRTRALAFPLFLSAFMLPIPAGFIGDLHLVLRHISAWGAEGLVDLWGIPVLRQGTTLWLPEATVEVADSCSGFSTLYASIALGAILAYLSRSNARRSALMASAVVLAVACNMVRVAGLVLIIHYFGADPLKTTLHPASGVATFAVAFAVLLSMADHGVLRGARA